ncbi:MAG: hypothetical protein ACLFQS_00175 [Bacteroidales bacterium]
MKKLRFILAILLITVVLPLSAQDYSSSIGVRGGFFSGVSGKFFIDNEDAIEVVGALHYSGLLVAGMFQRHANAFDAPGLNWYYGGGVHLGFYEMGSTPWYDDESGNVSTLGLNGVLGLEYKIEEIPFTVGIDITPAFNLVGHTGYWMSGGVTLRYILN